MKRLRVAALGLVVVALLLAAAPAALAQGASSPGRFALARQGAWLTDWFEWLGDLFAPAAPRGPRAVTAATGGCLDPLGKPIPCPPAPADGGDDNDTGGCLDPLGNPAPCP